MIPLFYSKFFSLSNIWGEHLTRKLILNWKLYSVYHCFETLRQRKQNFHPFTYTNRRREMNLVHYLEGYSTTLIQRKNVSALIISQHQNLMYLCIKINRHIKCIVATTGSIGISAKSLISFDVTVFYLLYLVWWRPYNAHGIKTIPLSHITGIYKQISWLFKHFTRKTVLNLFKCRTFPRQVLGEMLFFTSPTLIDPANSVVCWSQRE